MNLTQTYQLNRHGFIEASAGTGKTYTLERLVARLIREGTEIEKILILTFTEKATGEMRYRIRQHLKNEKENTNDAVIQTRLNDALLNFDTATICTIHAFCNTLLHQHGFEMGANLISEVYQDSSLADMLLSKIMREWSENEHDAEFELLLTDFQQSWLDEVKEVSRFYRNDGFMRLIPAHAEDVSVRHQIEDTISSIIKLFDNDDTIENLYEEFHKKFKLHPKTYQAQLRKLIAPLSLLLNSDLKRYTSLWYMILYTAMDDASFDIHKDSYKKLISVKSPVMSDPLYMLFKNLNIYLNQLLLLLIKVRSSLKVKMIECLSKELIHYRNEKGWISYDDMVHSVASALDHPDTMLAIKLRSRYSHVFVDEFQDTDAAQWKILENAFLKKGETKIFLIGDPKQSIYGFRGTNIHVYLNAKDVLPDKNIYQLDTNYRTNIALLDTFNHIFNELFQASASPTDEHSYQTDNRIHYTHLKAGVDVYITDTQKNNFVSVDLNRFSVSANERLWYQYIASEIKRLLDAKTEFVKITNNSTERSLLTYSSFAVLVRTKSSAEKLEGFLRQAKIPYSFYKKAGIYQSTECIAILAALECFAYPMDIFAFRKFLISPFIKKNLNEMSLSLDAKLNKLFVDLRMYASLRLWHRFFYALVYESNFAVRTYQSESLSNADRILTNIMQIIELLLEYTVKKERSAADLFSMLYTLRHDVYGTETENLHRLESEEPRVQILTMHASKGLEFPVLFLGGTFGRSVTEDYFRYYDNSVTIYDVAKLDKTKHRQEEKEEAKRLLYVAMTRAQARLYVPYFSFNAKLIEQDKKTQLNPLYDSLNRILSKFEDHEELFEDDETQIDMQEDNVHQTDLSEGKLCDPMQFKNRRYRISAFSYLSNAIHNDENEFKDMLYAKDDDEKSQSADEDDLPAGPVTGNAIHYIFEKIDFEIVKKVSAFNEFYAHQDVANLLQEAQFQFPSVFQTKNNLQNEADLILEKRKQKTAALIYNTLTSKIVIGQESFTLSDIKQCDRKSEVEFHFLVDHKYILNHFYIKGYIDLLFRYKNRYYILDWKSNKLANGYDLSSIHEAMNEHNYHLQYKLYLIALDRYLAVTLPDYKRELHLGGALYIFARGMNPNHSQEGYYIKRVASLEMESWEKELIELIRIFTKNKKTVKQS